MNIPKSRIAFGSCNNQNLTQPIWSSMIERNPSVFVWGGDAIYGDHTIKQDFTKFPPQSIVSPATPERLRQYYNQQKRNKDYQRFLRSTNVTVIGTIDDHDMGCNNGDKLYEYKREAGIEFMRFILDGKNVDDMFHDESDDQNYDTYESQFDHSIMYQRAFKGLGVFGVQVYDFSRREGDYLLSDVEAGIDPDVVGYDANNVKSCNYNTETSVAIFVLDARTNRTPWGKGMDGWKPNYEGDFLGERQWAWFESAIRRSQATVNIIVNGLQVSPYRHPSANFFEVWSQFPTARQRLFDTILQDNVRAPLLVTGDVHMAQLMRKDCIRKNEIMDEDPHIRPIVELTTSGMTHAWGTVFASTEKFHKSWRYYYLHFCSKSLMSLAHYIFPMPDIMTSNVQRDKRGIVNSEDDTVNLYANGGAEHSKQGLQYSLELNFGELEFDWDQQIISARVFGQHMHNPPLISAKWTFDQLSGLTSLPGRTTSIDMVNRLGKYYVDGNVIDEGEFMCMNHRAPLGVAHLGLASLVLSSYLFILILIPLMLTLIVIVKFTQRFLAIRKR